MHVGTKFQNNCACDCSALPFWKGSYCETKTPCDSADKPCENNSTLTGTKFDNNCLCDCTATKYKGDLC